MKVSNILGNRIEKWMKLTSHHTRLIGFNIKAVSFADHRAGTSALRIEVGYLFGSLVFYPLKWDTVYKKAEKVLTLKEVLELDIIQGLN